MCLRIWNNRHSLSMKGIWNEVERRRLESSWSQSHQSSAGETLLYGHTGMPIDEGNRWRGGSETDSYSSSYDHFNPFRVGLDHLALAVEDPSMLEDLKQDLDAAGVPNNGVEEDPETYDKYISFHDPDGIAWELYSISTRSQV
jgi:catechol 2,3-dioxygenase-like lactoylglutathione lyase family enzyme